MFYCKNCKSQVEAGQAKCPVCGCDVVENYEVVCPTCGTQNRGGSRFCSTCGDVLPIIRKPLCIICGAQNVPGAKFCSSCGAPMVMADDTHSKEDIIEQRKQKLRIDLIEKERLEAVDKEISKRRENISKEEQKSCELIVEREKECDEYINSKAEKILRYKEIIENADSPDKIKLQKLSKAIRSYSRFLAAPFSELSDNDKKDLIYICPVCGAENSPLATQCYACGRNKERALQLAQQNKIVKIANFGCMNKKMVAPYEKMDIEDANYLKIDELEDKVKPHMFEEILCDEQQNDSGFCSENEQKKYVPNFNTVPFDASNINNGQYKVSPSLNGGKPGEAYQMPPIIQPVAFVPYVTQNQPILQYAEGNERSKNGEEK